jgi:O-antigen/teichoic acid export membrane protein
MLATAMTFLATQTDKLMLGKLFPLDFLGVYTVAYTFADLPRQVMNQVNSK